jgi:hypothetical protein
VDPLNVTPERPKYGLHAGRIFLKRLESKAARLRRRVEEWDGTESPERVCKWLRLRAFLLDHGVAVPALNIGDILSRKKPMKTEKGGRLASMNRACVRQSWCLRSVQEQMAGCRNLPGKFSESSLEKIPRVDVEEHVSENILVRSAKCLTDIRTKIENAPNTALKQSFEGQEQEASRQAWIAFQKALLIPKPSEESFSKSQWDSILEKLFGSIGTPGAGCVDFGGKTWYANSFHDAHTLFSLYLGRKVFPCATVSAMRAAGFSAAERLTTPPDPHRPNRELALSFLRLLAKDLFTRQSLEKHCESDTHWNTPVHDTSSSEGPHKRRLFYLERPPVSSKTKITPIKSGGKIRVITLGSYKDMRLSYLNKWMGRQIMREKWSIFGRSVSEWLAMRPDVSAWDGDFLSGDLESATDLFAPECADEVLRVIAEVSGEKFKDLSAGLTHASLFFGDNYMGEQEGGQLMGSLLSFPILCLVSATGFCISEGLALEYLVEIDPVKRKKLRDAWLFGVNGDDIIGCVRDGGEGWVEGTKAVGGRASRGKTLVNKEAFTVNSELWMREAGYWLAPGTIRPSLLLGICDGRRARPSALWESYRNSSIKLAPGSKELIEKRAKPHLPVSMGGVGAMISVLSRKFVREDVLEWYQRREVTRSIPVVKALWDEEMEELWRSDKESMCRFWVPREEQEDLQKKVDFPYAGTARWTDTPSVDWRSIAAPSDCKLKALYFEACEMEEQGLVRMNLPVRVYGNLDLREAPDLVTRSDADRSPPIEIASHLLNGNEERWKQLAYVGWTRALCPDKLTFERLPETPLPVRPNPPVVMGWTEPERRFKPFSATHFVTESPLQRVLRLLRRGRV